MQNTLHSFKQQQKDTIHILEKLLNFIQQGEALGTIQADSNLKTKVQQAIDTTTDEKLKVALIGGFSEGKTSIAAAWMEKLDKSTMNISHSESSNAVKIYEVGEEFVLVDTPGLFGFKENNENAGSDETVKYKEITKKYVSEAHLVLYVMNSTNPIKASHQEDLNWLFRSLNLLPRTVFVLSRFDEVADVEDEDDYQENLEIKQSNIKERLNEVLSLSADEKSTLSIVAVAANPFDMGIEHWLKNLTEFKKLSHIHTLQEATSNKIARSGGSTELIQEMQTSVISDVLDKYLPEAQEQEEKIKQELSKLEDLARDSNQNLKAIEKNIMESRRNLRDFATNYFADLIIQVKGSSLETIGAFIEREVGSEGVMISTKVQNTFERETESVTSAIQGVQVALDSEVNHFNDMVSSLGVQGIKHIAKGGYINNQTILATRDATVTVAKTVGLDIAKYLKFKPWGAVNAAKGLNGALAVVGLAFEAWDTYKQHERQKEFQKAQQKAVHNFEEQRKELLEVIDSDSFEMNFFSDYIDLKNYLQEINDGISSQAQRKQSIEQWKVNAEEIDSELKKLTS